MDQIIVVSRRTGGVKAPPGYSVVRVDRTTPLGNPYVMKSEAERCDVIRRYELWLDIAIEKRHGPAHGLYMELLDRAIRGEKLALECWCTPLPCHADVIKRRLDVALHAVREYVRGPRCARLESDEPVFLRPQAD